MTSIVAGVATRLRVAHVALGVTIGLAAGAAPLQGQALAQRIANAPDGRLQFSYAARDGACGDGRTFMRVTLGSGANEYFGSWNNGTSSQPCEPGPVRVFVGPVTASDGITDLGRVAARDAASYLLSLAARADGSVARDAIMPAMLADSADNQAALLAIARDATRARETRRSAISWAARTPSPAAVRQPLLGIVADDNDNRSVRQQALSTLVRLEGGTGVPDVIRLAGNRDGGWVAEAALSALAQSGDPRARDFLRQVVRATTASDDALTIAVRNLGQQYATAADVQLIREAYPRLTGPKSRSAALTAIAGFGGIENARFLMEVARDPASNPSTRQSALRSAVRAGVPVTELVTLYDSSIDYQMKDALIAALVESGERPAIDKLLAIARADDSVNARRKAIAALGRMNDPRIQRELEAIAIKR